MNKVPDSQFDPPEYPECPKCGEYVYAINDYKCEDCDTEKGEAWDTPTNHPYVERDADYWRNLK